MGDLLQQLFNMIDLYFINSTKEIQSNMIIISIEGRDCCGFQVKEDSLHIVFLSRQGSYSGTHILECLEFLVKATSDKIKYLDLNDDSFVKWRGNKFNLAYFHILCKGKSWYNSLGFFQHNYNDEFTKWSILRNKSMNVIFNEIIFNLKYNYENLSEDFVFLLEEYINKKLGYDDIVLPLNKYIEDYGLIDIEQDFYEIEEIFNRYYNFDFRSLKLLDIFQIIYVIVKNCDDVNDDIEQMIIKLYSYCILLIDYSSFLVKSL